MDMLDSYIIAEGPEGLEKVLDELLTKSHADSLYAAEDHYILYQLGAQKSLIKVDTTQMPFMFWHYDLLGRPATSTLKDVIAKFLWEKCGEKERYFEDMTGKH